MKKKMIIMILSLLLSVASINLLGIRNSATATVSAATSGIQPYSNRTGYKYTYQDGKLWKRLWSYTYNRWEEPHWTPA